MMLKKELKKIKRIPIVVRDRLGLASQADLVHLKSQLQDTQAELAKSKSQLQNTQTELAQLKEPSHFCVLRKRIAEQYLKGNGIEIGPLHQPLEIPSHATVRYIDRMPVDELKKLYPELSDYEFVEPDILDDGESLLSIPDSSVDFVIANHMIEHCENPIGTIEHHLRVLKQDGILYIAVPDKRCIFDRDRPITPLEHVLRDYREGPAWSMYSHFEEFARLVNKVSEEEVATHVQHLINVKYSIHYHVWTDKDFLQVILYCKENLGFSFELELFQKNGFEFIVILRKTNVVN
ncbi:methyltransferase domain-containing protein [Scytonema sp. NUACC26]|uniref:methyltransferase domain-containing protein n=1 Tax=Scytonema sp. NUACC26 TaxID=3140176 RepID=UPI0034DBC070